MVDETTIDAMVAAGCSVEQLAAVVKAALRADAERAAMLREAAAERQRKSRARRDGHTMSRDVTVTTRDMRDLPIPPSGPLVPPSPEPLSPLNPPNLPPFPSGDARFRGGSPVTALQGFGLIDAMLARRFADHCAEKGRRLSVGQAEAIVVELKSIEAGGGSPSAAVERAIGMGWTTIRADGREAGGGARASPAMPAGRKDLMGAIRAKQAKLDMENGSISTSYVRHSEAGDHVPRTLDHGRG